MATIDLGKIKQVFRGTYNNATAYVPDDLVVFTDTGITSTYICTTASTGNNPSSGGTAHANWAYIAKGVTDPIPSQSGNSGKFLKTNGSALSFATAGGLLQAKQWVKNSTITNTNTTDAVLASPFDGTAQITPAAAGNIIKATFFTTIDHSQNWRSNKLRMDYSTDGGSNWKGIAGMSITTGSNSGNHMYGNNGMMVCMFNPNTTNPVYVRVITNAHDSGVGKQFGQYNNESGDGSTIAPDSLNGVIAAGHGILLEEYASAIASVTAIA